MPSSQNADNLILIREEILHELLTKFLVDKNGLGKGSWETAHEFITYLRKEASEAEIAVLSVPLKCLYL